MKLETSLAQCNLKRCIPKACVHAPRDLLTSPEPLNSAKSGQCEEHQIGQGEVLEPEPMHLPPSHRFQIYRGQDVSQGMLSDHVEFVEIQQVDQRRPSFHLI